MSTASVSCAYRLLTQAEHARSGTEYVSASVLHSLLDGVEERRVRLAHVEDHDPQRLGGAAVVARHLHVRGLHHRLAGLHGDRLVPLHLQREGAFEDVDGYRRAERMRPPSSARSW